MRHGSIAVVLALAIAGPARAEQVLYVGDSLGVGTTPGLARELGSTAQLHGDSRIGRPSSEGLQVLQRTIAPSDDVVVFDLGTNDDPAQPARLASDLAAARHATGNRCLIVATLNRPPLNGVPVDGLNNAVLAFASGAKNVQLVDWNAIVASEPGLLGPDHVHPTPQGYALRAQLFAQAVGACARPKQTTTTLTPTPAPKRKARPRKPHPAIKVPGIESSGISFTEPLRFRGRQAQLLLPNTKPPYPAVVMLGATQVAAEFMAAHGIATLTYRDRGSPADARAAVALLRRRDDVRRNGVAVWAFGNAGTEAAAAAEGNQDVAALVVVSPAVLPPAEQRDWRIRRAADDAPLTNWIRLQARMDSSLEADPAATWRRVEQPLLAMWGTRDDRIPIRASAARLKAALEAGDNRDRTFRWFDASHGGAVVYKDGEPVYAPGMLEETARWLGLHLGAKRAPAAINTPLPPRHGGPDVEDVANPSVLYAPPLQALWLLVPALMLGAAAMRSEGLIRLVAGTTAAAIACFAAIALGAATLVHSPGKSVATVAGTAWPFALAVVLAAALAVCAVVLARRHAWLAAAGAALWLALALFWLV